MTGLAVRSTDLLSRVTAAVHSVTDPEYPDVSIADLGLVERIDVNDTEVRVGLIPTMSGCPALAMIEHDVRAAVASVLDTVAHETQVVVEFLHEPVWTPERISGTAVSFLRTEYTVTIRPPSGPTSCPVCEGRAVEPRSEFGSTPCRAVAWCPDCRNPIEVIRR
ncbi:MAG: ring-1,2-phenylacetyl-CoA epoxidase subunit PaaD [Candidatus Poriferisodalaceae bacterium]|jgi:ring-1,2-phenylacetyl-CoA epoxidase subunit PaaD